MARVNYPTLLPRRGPGDLRSLVITRRRSRLERLRADTPIAAEFETPEGEVVNAPIADVRQGLVEPTNNAFPVENTLVLEPGDGRFTVGGEGAFIEDDEAREIALSATDTAKETETEGE